MGRLRITEMPGFLVNLTLNHGMKYAFLFLSLCLHTVYAQHPAPSNHTAARLQIAEAMENSLQRDLLAQWYPRSLDTAYGGFISSYTYDFNPAPNQDKMIVTQARHTWVNAKAAALYPSVTYYKTG